MDSYELLPKLDITPSGEISNKFLSMGIKTFKEACNYVHNLEYGYNSDTDDRWILFKELKGSCTPKHGVIAGLAEELQVPQTWPTTDVIETSEYNLVPMTQEEKDKSIEQFVNLMNE